MDNVKRWGAWIWHHSLWWLLHGIFWWFIWRRMLVPSETFVRHLWVRRRALRRFLRAQDVLTWLGGGALAVAIGGVGVVIGIGEVQIGSSHGGSRDLWNNIWFGVGYWGTMVGFLCLLTALGAKIAQVAQGKRFPNLQFTIYSLGRVPFVNPMALVVPDPTTGAIVLPVALEEVGVRVRNRETTRAASLEFMLVRKLTEPIPPGISDWEFFPPTDERVPWTIQAGTTERKVVNFDVRGDPPRPLAPTRPNLVAIDHNSGRSVSFPASIWEYDEDSWTIVI